MIKVIAVHKDSTKYVMADVAPEDVAAFANEALATFRRDLGDSDIYESRVVVIQLEGSPKVLSVGQLDYINNPPQNQPVVIKTHGA